MNNVEDIKNSIPDFAKDIRLNFSSIIMNSVYEDDLTYGCAYACALSLNDKKLSKALENECRNRVSEDFVLSIKSAVSIMSLNNILQMHGNDNQVLMKDFKNSLMAAYTVNEVEKQISIFKGIKSIINIVSDRHFFVTIHVEK